MRRTSIWIALALFGILTGCAGGPLTPYSVPLGQHDLTFVKSKKPVGVINKQEIKQTEIEANALLPSRSHSVQQTQNLKVDLNSWCDETIHLIGQWLTFNNIPVDQNADKKLYVSVLNPKANDRGSYSFDIRIETAGGSVKTFATECTAGRAGSAVGYAINWGVVKIIHDPDILSYMEQ